MFNYISTKNTKISIFILLQGFIRTEVQDTHEFICCFVTTNVHQTNFKY